MPPTHLQTIEWAERAKVAGLTLDGIAEDSLFTCAARNAASLRWKVGSVVLYLALSRKKQRVDEKVVKGPDGSPIEINDQWVRWKYTVLSDFMWDVHNLSRDFREHETLAMERFLTVRQFQQEFGDLAAHGLNENELPTMGQLAPHKTSAAQIGGTNIFEAYRRQSDAKAIRVIEWFLSDANDPGNWPTMYQIFDTSPMTSISDQIGGKVVNFENPVNPYGHRGLPFAKLDGFWRDDSPWCWGLPHLLMGQQDLINIARSIQYQQLVSSVFGMWLVDKQTYHRETFTNQLAEGVGGVLEYDSRQQNLPPPQFVTPDRPNQEFILIAQDLIQGMRDQAHVAPVQRGIGKTHQPAGAQEQLLQQANAVVDNVVLEDSDCYGEFLKTTLGTVRTIMDGPNRMLARLRDNHGFKARHLQTLHELDPKHLLLVVKVRQNSVVSRSAQERKTDLMEGLQLGLVAPVEVAIEMSESMERPILISHQKQIQFIRHLLLNIKEGAEYQGIPSIDFALFERIAKEAIYELDFADEQERAQIGMIDSAILIQRQINQELNPPEGAEQGGGEPAAGPTGTLPQGTNLLPPGTSGAPESINPTENPVGAAGGLPLGLG
jgi:hypothetical protein